MKTGGSGATGVVFDIDRFAIHDGPGIRMAVYFKGCPLSCAWCHSPESRRREKELILLRDRCVVCGGCVDACPRGAHDLGAESARVHAIDRERCAACGSCVAACPEHALAIKGEAVTAGEVVARAVRMKPFFEHSGGGVTLTGGEVTLQADFAAAILDGCRAAGVTTAFETCGACDWPRLRRLADRADLILYDLKLIGDQEHRRWTGASNRRILANAGRLAGYPVVIRTPLIPGVTDTDANLAGIFEFMRESGLRAIELLPYNPSSAAKYDWLGLRYEIEGDRQPAERLEEIAAHARAFGLTATVLA